MRTLFIGSTRRGFQALETLVELGAELTGILSLEQADSERERYEGRIKTLAERHGIPFRQTRRLNEMDYGAWIRDEVRPDVAFVVGCRVILAPEITKAPKLGCLALHDSLLPSYRGFAPTNWAVLNGETRTGVTLFELCERMDGGKVLGSREIGISGDESAASVFARVCDATISLIREFYPKLVAGSVQGAVQNEENATFSCSRRPDDGWIDWSQPTRAIYNQVRALAQPYPGAFTAFEGKRLWVWKATLVEPAPVYVGRIAGRVIRVSRSLGTVDVLTGDGVLRLHEVQRPGGTVERAAEVIRSVRAHLGFQVPELLARIEALEARLSTLGAGPTSV